MFNIMTNIYSIHYSILYFNVNILIFKSFQEIVNKKCLNHKKQIKQMYRILSEPVCLDHVGHWAMVRA